MLTRVRQSQAPWRELQAISAVVVNSNEARALQQLVRPCDFVDDDELKNQVLGFAYQKRTTRRLCLLRELAVKVGDLDQLRHLLTSADQLHMGKLLTDVLHDAPADKRQEMTSLLLNLSDTQYETCANRNFRHHGRTAFHEASAYGYHELLPLLLPSKPEDCNALTSTGETALHTLVRGAKDARYIRVSPEMHLSNIKICTTILVEKMNININAKDNGGYTAVHLACIRKLWDIVSYLIEKQADVDVFVNGESARDIISQDKSDIVISYPVMNQQTHDSTSYLFQLIKDQEEDTFMREITNNNFNLNNGDQTLLQATVQHGLTKATKKLLDLGADINEKCSDIRTPVMLAVCNCDEEMLEILLQYKNLNLSLLDSNGKLHSVLHKAVEHAKPDCQCVRLLCGYKLNNSLDINASDYRSKTPLHYAVERRQENNIVYLLRNKANIFMKCDEDVPAFAGADFEYLSGFLDDQMTIEGSAYDKNNKYSLLLNFDFLVIPKEKIVENKIVFGRESDKENSCLVQFPESNSRTPDMDSLKLLAKSKPYKALLNHPIIRSFLHLKWHQFFWLFYINFLFLTTFTVSFSIYIYGLVNEVNRKDGQKNSTAVTVDASDNEHKGFYLFFRVLACLTLLFLIVREIFQIYVSVSFWHYISYVVNIIEVILIFVSGFLLLFVSYDYHAIHTLSAIGILLVFTELVFLIGSHPVLTVYYTMLFRVAKDFLYFLLWYSLLVVAFGISFYILFQHCEGDDCSGNLFVSVWTAIFKTTVMLQGEFDANSLQFDSFSVISHITFLFFFFSMVIVLMNLLNGLAVSDIQIIKTESDIICMESQVKLYAKFENIIFNVISKKFDRLGAKLIEQSILLSGLLKENKLELILKKKNRMDPDVRNSCNRSCFDCNSGKMCGLNLNCLKSKHFKKLFPLCFEFDKIVDEMKSVHKLRCHEVRKIDAEMEEERTRNRNERQEQRMLMERQDKLEQIMSTMNMKLDAVLSVFQNKFGMDLKF